VADHDDGNGHQPLATLADPEALARFARPERRIDGPGKVTGETRYAGDRTMPGALWAAFLSSQVAHGRIRRIDTSAARAMPGVHAVLTGDDIGDVRFGRQLLDRPVLVRDRVRFVGDRIAAVAADTLEQAEAAVAAIEVDIEELEPILEPEAALAPDAPVLHPDASSYRYLAGQRPPTPHANVQGHVVLRRGDEDLKAVFARAHRVFEHEFRTPRQHHGYIEPHATLVWIDADEIVHVVTTNKAPQRLRQLLSASLGIPPERLDVDAGAIGGDFGGKGYSVDEYACYFLARETGRPVRAVTSYAEELAALNVRHASKIRLRSAVDEQGRLIAHEARVIMDGGAYASAKPMPHLTPAIATAILPAYRCPNVLVDVQTVYTNSVPGGHMRAPGGVQGLFAGESHIDAMARELGMDPIEFRRRNLAQGDDESVIGERFREARGVEVLEAAADAVGWNRPLPEGRGRGVAVGVHHVGAAIGPHNLRLRLLANGTVEVTTGLADQGSGMYTVIRRVVAATASIDESRVRIVRATTATAPLDPGIGGSWVTHMASRSSYELGTRLREWIDGRVPRALPDAPSSATLRDDALVDTATGATLLGFDELAARLVAPDDPVELAAAYTADAHGPGAAGDQNFAACAVELSVDRETGVITIHDAVLASDVGTIISPIGHTGQLEGGFAFGIGTALMEELVVEDGLVTGRSLGETRLPAIRDVPPLRHVFLPTTLGPGAFGAKAAGEMSNAPVPPAIANAIADATGVRITELPLTPERVLGALAAADGGVPSKEVAR
jgi:CO/xanthine dehydrogenase Mo-binding subunit